MADLFFASLEAPPLSFVSTHHCPFSLRRPLPLRFSALNLQLKKHQAAAADSAEFGILSSKEHSDGSIIFRFGDVQEIAAEASLEPESVADVDSAEVEDVHEKVDHNPEEIKSLVRRKQRRRNVKLIGNRDSREGSGQPVAVVEKETSRVTKEDHEHEDDKIGVSNSGFACKEDLVSISDEEKVVEDVADIRESSDGEVEVLGVDHQHHSVASGGGEGDALSSFFREDNTSDGNARGLIVAPVESEVESNLSKGSVIDTADGSVDEHVTETPDVSDDNSASSFSEDNGTEGAAGTSDLVTVPIPDQLELQMIGTNLERDEISPKGYHLSSGAALLPHPLKAFAGGEDSFFITQNWVGVADGIALWSFQGTSPGQYARELMENCQKIIFCSNLGLEIDPVEVLSRSVTETQSAGASTLLLAFFDNQALHVANIGDTGFIVIRDGMVFKKSSPMVHEFSFPIRLQKGDHPSEYAEVYKVDLHEGDCIVIATDGLFDNLHELEIVSIVSRSLQDQLKPQEMAELLVSRAEEVGQSSSARTPYSDAAQAAGYVGYRGGKVDDVTVIVSLVETLER